MVEAGEQSAKFAWGTGGFTRHVNVSEIVSDRMTAYLSTLPAKVYEW